MAFPSPSGAPPSRQGTTGPPLPLPRLLDSAGRAPEPVHGFRSLLPFEAEFRPEYHPLYPVYPDPAALPGVTRAISRAYPPRLSPTQGLRPARRPSS